MKHRTLRQIRQRYLDALKRGQYTRAAYIKRYLATCKELMKEVAA